MHCMYTLGYFLIVCEYTIALMAQRELYLCMYGGRIYVGVCMGEEYIRSEMSYACKYVYVLKSMDTDRVWERISWWIAFSTC